MNELNLRVGLQSKIGVTLLWNREALEEEQRKSVAVFARLTNGDGALGEWMRPKTVRPPLTGNLALIMTAEPEDTDFIMIPYTTIGILNERVTFDVRLDFGDTNHTRSATYRVEPHEQHTRFAKQQVDMGPGQKPIHADRVYLTDASDLLIDKFADRVSDKVAEKTAKSILRTFFNELAEIVNRIRSAHRPV